MAGTRLPLPSRSAISKSWRPRSWPIGLRTWAVICSTGCVGLSRHAVVGDVRGKGLCRAIELVKDRATKEPVDAAAITSVVDFCRDQGVIVGRGGGGRRFGNVIVLSPPLVITRAECDRLVDTLDRALAALPGDAVR